MAKVNKKKDQFFWRKLKSGYYTVDKYGVIRNRKGKPLGTVNSRGYVTIGCKDKHGKLLVFQAHRLVRNNKITRREIARRKGCSSTTAIWMISGRTYPHLPLAI